MAFGEILDCSGVKTFFISKQTLQINEIELMPRGPYAQKRPETLVLSLPESEL